MKLPNFLLDGHLNSLRFEMGAPMCQTFKAARVYVPIELPIAEVLRDRGMDVDFQDIQRLEDGTLGYKGHRVLVYIRDINSYDDKASLPKFHVAYCATLEKMRQQRRWQRYVVANRDDGKFLVHIMSEAARPRIVSLFVCQNCLTALNWNGFADGVEQRNRLRLVREFSLQEFFSVYPRDLVSVRPQFTSDTAPLNEYTDDWPDVSERAKNRAKYSCSACGIKLSLRLSRYLHVHHLNGLKYDNSDGNLEVLCIGCHAEEPLHGHMKKLPDYIEFMATYRNERG